MKNQKFILSPDSEKQRKLSNILRSRTNDSLTLEQLQHITHSIMPGVQYDIEVFTKPSVFCDALVLKHSDDGYDRGKIVFGQALFGNNGADSRPGQLYQERSPAAAIITRSSGIPETTARVILIYVPPHLYLKGTGTHEEQRVHKESCV